MSNSLGSFLLLLKNDALTVLKSSCHQHPPSKHASENLINISANDYIIIDSLPIGHSPKSLLQFIKANGPEALNELQGQFCGFVAIGGKKIIAFTDKLGSKALYYKDAPTGLLIGSNWKDFCPPTPSWNPQGLSETFRYRSLSHHYSLLPGCKTCPSFHYTVINQDHTLKFKPLWSVPPRRNSSPFKSIKSLKGEVASEIKKQFQKIYPEHKTAAVLLSGGVDSFLMAALACEVFDKVVAYTPFWKGGENPECENALYFAKILDIEHKLVEVCESEIEDRLTKLIDTLGSTVRNFSSVVLDCLIENIADEYKLVIYGQAADTLFGERDVKIARIDSMIGDLLRLLPASLFRTLTEKSKRYFLLKKLRESSHFDLAESISAITYPRESQDPC